MKSVILDDNELQMYVQHAKLIGVNETYIVTFQIAFTTVDWFLKRIKYFPHVWQHAAPFNCKIHL